MVLAPKLTGVTEAGKIKKKNKYNWSLFEVKIII